MSTTHCVLADAKLYAPANGVVQNAASNRATWRRQRGRWPMAVIGLVNLALAGYLFRHRLD